MNLAATPGPSVCGGTKRQTCFIHTEEWRESRRLVDEISPHMKQPVSLRGGEARDPEAWL